MSSYEAAKESALAFTRKFAEEAEFFTGGDVLAAFRASGLPGSELDWRNKWGAVINTGAKKLWFVRAGRAVPTSKQSHTGSLTLWKSRLFSGEQSLVAGNSDIEARAELRKKLLCREITVDEALWQAFSLGFLRGQESAKS